MTTIYSITSTVLLLTCLAVVGCTTVAPGPDGVQITNEPEVVAGCRPVGNVETETRSSTSGDDLADLRKRAYEMGADTVLVTTRGFGRTSGVAYRCAP